MREWQQLNAPQAWQAWRCNAAALQGQWQGCSAGRAAPRCGSRLTWTMFRWHRALMRQSMHASCTKGQRHGCWFRIGWHAQQRPLQQQGPPLGASCLARGRPSLRAQAQHILPPPPLLLVLSISSIAPLFPPLFPQLPRFLPPARPQPPLHLHEPLGCVAVAVKGEDLAGAGGGAVQHRLVHVPTAQRQAGGEEGAYSASQMAAGCSGGSGGRWRRSGLCDSLGRCRPRAVGWPAGAPNKPCASAAPDADMPMPHGVPPHHATAACTQGAAQPSGPHLAPVPSRTGCPPK